MKLSIVIPVYNEKDTILAIIKSINDVYIPGIEKEIVLVEDFSTDGTKELLKDLKYENLKIIYNENNSGKGASIRKGLAEAKGDFVIIQDADLEYNPQEYKKLIEPLMREDADLVYGSRFLRKPFIWKTYYLANRVLTLLSNIFTGFNLTDMETCYKCFSRNALEKMLPHLKANRFDIEPEITAVVAKLGLKIIEVPISYCRRSYKEGKKIGFKDSFQAIWTIIKLF